MLIKEIKKKKEGLCQNTGEVKILEWNLKNADSVPQGRAKGGGSPPKRGDRREPSALTMSKAKSAQND